MDRRLRNFAVGMWVWAAVVLAATMLAVGSFTLIGYLIGLAVVTIAVIVGTRIGVHAAGRRGLTVRFFGAPPSPDASRTERLEWIRRFYLRPLIFTVPVYIWAALAISETWAYLGLAAGALVWVWGVGSLTLRIRRERRAESA